MKADVLIVGGGVIGLAIACELKKRGAGSVAVLERGLIGNESSSAAAGMLAVQAETGSPDTFFDFCNTSRNLYPEFAASLLDETGVDIELDRTGTIYLAFDEEDSADIRQRHEWQSSAGLDVRLLSSDEVLELEPALNPAVIEAAFFANDWQVENKKLIEALAARAVAVGIDIVENCEVTSLLAAGSKIEAVQTATAEHSGGAIILATGAWTSLIECPSFSLPEVKPIKGEMLTFGPERGLLRHVIYSRKGYVVPRSDGRLLAGATSEDVGFDKSITAAAEESISQAAFQIAPRLETLGIKDRWAGLRPYTSGGKPVICRIPDFENAILATGHFRNGILLAPATATLVADMLEGAESPFSGAFAY